MRPALRRWCVVAGLAALVPSASPLRGQSRAARLVNGAFAQLNERRLDSAEALLRPVLDSTLNATLTERGAALMLLGVIDFYRARDSAAARDFRASLALTLALKGEWLTRVDSSLGVIWRREQMRARCGFGDRDSVALAASVDSTLLTTHPRVLKGPRPTFPMNLRRAGLSGRVLVSAVVDTMGRAEPGSITVIDSPHADFSREARRYVEAATFDPARVAVGPTRVCIQIPIDFKITGLP